MTEQGWQRPEPHGDRGGQGGPPAWSPQQPPPGPGYQGGYGPPGYGPPGYNPSGWYGPPSGYPGYGPQAAPTNGLATASLVLGIIFVIICFAGLLSFLGSVLAISFGAVGIGRANKIGGLNKGKAIAGLVLGIFALFFYFIVGLATLGIGWFV